MGAPVGCLFPKGSPGEPSPFCTSLHLETGRWAQEQANSWSFSEHRISFRNSYERTMKGNPLHSSDSPLDGALKEARLSTMK